MNRRTIVILTLAVAVAGFAAAAFYRPFTAEAPPPAPAAAESSLVRPHSPVIGPADAPVTLVEFFDPSCEACRAYYPVVKEILAENSGSVRLVLRYTPFHQGSDEAVKILEAARMQDKFQPVLEALLEAQPNWAVDGAPRLEVAWQTAEQAGLDINRAKTDAASFEVDRILRADIADVQAAGIERTPTFFINGKPLAKFGSEELRQAVRDEVERVKVGG